MVSKIGELKLLGKVEIADEATAEEKDAIINILKRAGLFVFQKGYTLYIRVEANDNTSHLPTK